MKTSLKVILCTLLAIAPAAAQNGDDIPAHPSEIKFQPLDYQPPQRQDYAHQLKHGVSAYLAEDHDLPLVNISLSLRIGSYLDPAGKEGLAEMTGSLLRSGGNSRWKAEDFDEEADFLAANLGASIGNITGSAQLNILSKDLDRGLELFFEMLHHPAFQQDRVDLYKSQSLQQMERRNDRTPVIEAREWTRLTRGPEFFLSLDSTKASIESITRQDMIDFHDRYFVPANFIFAVSGDFKTDEMMEKLNQALAAWESAGQRSAEVPAPDYDPVPGVYMVDKPDVNQGRVTIGHLGIKWGNPDETAIDLMNEILGGSGFTSRITNRVRSDEGLAYSAFSTFNAEPFFPGLFYARFQSKSASCAEAAQIALDEIRRIRSEPVQAEELETVRSGAIEAFPRLFSTPRAVVGTFAGDELLGRDPEYWNTYRDRLRAVTVEDIQRVAKQYLMPDKLVILAVGNKADMLKGNPDKPQYSFEKLAPAGGIIDIPLPDPLTLKYPEK